MRRRLIEGGLVAAIVGVPLRLIEILIRCVHLGVRALRLMLQRVLRATVDAALAKRARHRLARTATVDSASVVFVTESGEYAGDAKYVVEELMRRDRRHRITWVTGEDALGPYPEQAALVAPGGLEFYSAVAGAKIVVQEARVLQDAGVEKSDDQYWVHTGPHGTARVDPRFDLVIAADRADADALGERVEAGTEIAAYGHARNDVLLERDPELATAYRRRALSWLGIPERGQRFLLHLPVPDDDGSYAAAGSVDFPAVRRALSARFGGEWEFLIRTGAATSGTRNPWTAGLPHFCHDASRYPDAQELAVISDAALADDDASIRDYLLTGKPAFCLAIGDAPSGSETRSVALPVATTNAELLRAIETHDSESFDRAVAEELQMRGSCDDGRAAERLVDWIERLLPS